MHNSMMKSVLEKGTLKNYFSTAAYLKRYLSHKYQTPDIALQDLNYQFISGLEFYIRNNPIKANDPCTNDGTMKHLERIKKMVTWATTNEWVEKDPFSAYKLKFKRTEKEFLQKDELATVETRDFDNPMLQKVRDLFVFSCYTGLAYVDLMELKQFQILTAGDGMKWIKAIRRKTNIPINIPLLSQAISILDKYQTEEAATKRETDFPQISNQEVNRGLKLIGEIWYTYGKLRKGYCYST